MADVGTAFVAVQQFKVFRSCRRPTMRDNDKTSGDGLDRVTRMRLIAIKQLHLLRPVVVVLNLTASDISLQRRKLRTEGRARRAQRRHLASLFGRTRPPPLVNSRSTPSGLLLEEEPPAETATSSSKEQSPGLGNATSQRPMPRNKLATLHATKRRSSSEGRFEVVKKSRSSGADLSNESFPLVEQECDSAKRELKTTPSRLRLLVNGVDRRPQKTLAPVRLSIGKRRRILEMFGSDDDDDFWLLPSPGLKSRVEDNVLKTLPSAGKERSEIAATSGGIGSKSKLIAPDLIYVARETPSKVGRVVKPVKPPIIPVKPPTIPVKPPIIPVKPPTIPVKPPIIPVKPPTIPVKQPIIPIKPPTQAKPPTIPVKQPIIPAKPPIIPIKSPTIPVKPPIIPAKPPIIPINPPTQVKPPIIPVKPVTIPVKPPTQAKPPIIPVKPPTIPVKQPIIQVPTFQPFISQAKLSATPAQFDQQVPSSVLPTSPPRMPSMPLLEVAVVSSDQTLAESVLLDADMMYEPEYLNSSLSISSPHPALFKHLAKRLSSWSGGSSFSPTPARTKLTTERKSIRVRSVLELNTEVTSKSDDDAVQAPPPGSQDAVQARQHRSQDFVQAPPPGPLDAVQARQHRSQDFVQAPPPGPLDAVQARQHRSQDFVQAPPPGPLDNAQARLPGPLDAVQARQNRSQDAIQAPPPGSLDAVLAPQHRSLDAVQAPPHRSLDAVLARQHRSLDAVQAPPHRSLAAVLARQHRSLDAVQAPQNRSLDNAQTPQHRSLDNAQTRLPRSLAAVLARQHRSQDAVPMPRPLDLQIPLKPNFECLAPTQNETAIGAQVAALAAHLVAVGDTLIELQELRVRKDVCAAATLRTQLLSELRAGHALSLDCARALRSDLTLWSVLCAAVRVQTAQQDAAFPRAFTEALFVLATAVDLEDAVDKCLGAFVAGVEPGTGRHHVIVHEASEHASWPSTPTNLTPAIDLTHRIYPDLNQTPAQDWMKTLGNKPSICTANSAEVSAFLEHGRQQKDPDPPLYGWARPGRPPHGSTILQAYKFGHSQKPAAHINTNNFTGSTRSYIRDQQSYLPVHQSMKPVYNSNYPTSGAMYNYPTSGATYGAETLGATIQQNQPTAYHLLSDASNQNTRSVTDPLARCEESQRPHGTLSAQRPHGTLTAPHVRPLPASTNGLLIRPPETLSAGIIPLPPPMFMFSTDRTSRVPVDKSHDIGAGLPPNKVTFSHGTRLPVVANMVFVRSNALERMRYQRRSGEERFPAMLRATEDDDDDRLVIDID